MLPVMGKLLEKIVCKRLMGFLESRRLLSLHQFGFRRGERDGVGMLSFDGVGSDRILSMALGTGGMSRYPGSV